MLLERIFAHFKALCCILSASTLLCLGVHLLCIHDAPFLDQCLMCILLHSCILYSMTFLRILTHSERLLRILGCMGGCSGEAPRHARPGMTAGIYFFPRCILCAFCTHLRASLPCVSRTAGHGRSRISNAFRRIQSHLLHLHSLLCILSAFICILSHLPRCRSEWHSDAGEG